MMYLVHSWSAKLLESDPPSYPSYKRNSWAQSDTSTPIRSKLQDDEDSCTQQSMVTSCLMKYEMWRKVSTCIQQEHTHTHTHSLRCLSRVQKWNGTGT